MKKQQQNLSPYDLVAKEIVSKYDDYKNYILGLIFYRFLSENEKMSYLNKVLTPGFKIFFSQNQLRRNWFWPNWNFKWLSPLKRPWNN
ncbi:type I restriction-modification system subunit M N-terminal domain-containing protein [Mesomycoplasma ovipneumoniae]|uniref:type I restriction-modification system subunit M N-terminal domain-containing protein n=1 Tax=Mesomycoplasma ovipneumoniae TaxID=29562 RepID=UPI002964BD40|nr:type I restriction-modification system subunit M N-terminal domain-containing protein [Mesomycoplasma ovipneumoniae]MDW2930466.1 type I restriction-modification system subunit M N-terminal domain-containing protein [Mesomycoplasma ovipneumoniae]